MCDDMNSPTVTSYTATHKITSKCDKHSELLQRFLVLVEGVWAASVYWTVVPAVPPPLVGASIAVPLEEPG